MSVEKKEVNPVRYANLPNFFILGAAKAGTTSLYEYLKLHPQIFLPYVKEPQFFCNDLLYSEGLVNYLETHFKGAEGFPARGEATPHYLFYEKAAQRLAETLPETHQKFIVILRDPVERAYSLYWNMVHEGYETLSFEQAIKAEYERRCNADDIEKRGTLRFQYVESGMYAQQLNRYLKYFSLDKFLILLQADLARDPAAELKKVLRFIAVEDSMEIDVNKKFNVASSPRSRIFQNLVVKPNKVRRILGKLFPTHFKYWIVTNLLRWNKRDMLYPAMNPRTASKLRSQFNDDVLELESLIGRKLTAWLEPKEQ